MTVVVVVSVVFDATADSSNEDSATHRYTPASSEDSRLWPAAAAPVRRTRRGRNPAGRRRLGGTTLRARRRRRARRLGTASYSSHRPAPFPCRPSWGTRRRTNDWTTAVSTWEINKYQEQCKEKKEPKKSTFVNITVFFFCLQDASTFYLKILPPTHLCTPIRPVSHSLCRDATTNFSVRPIDT